MANEREWLWVHTQITDYFVRLFPVARIIVEYALIVTGLVLLAILAFLHTFHLQIAVGSGCFKNLETDSLGADIIEIIVERHHEYVESTGTPYDQELGGNDNMDISYSPSSNGACGAFRLEGYLLPKGQLWLEPVEWTRRPQGFWMVSIKGEVRSDGSISGEIPECEGPYNLIYQSQFPSNGDLLISANEENLLGSYQGWYFCNEGYHRFVLHHLNATSPQNFEVNAERSREIPSLTPDIDRPISVSAIVEFTHAGSDAPRNPPDTSQERSSSSFAVDEKFCEMPLSEASGGMSYIEPRASYIDSYYDDVLGSSFMNGFYPNSGKVWYYSSGKVEYRFSRDIGYLTLPKRELAKHGIRPFSITINSDDECLGTTWVQNFLKHFVGYRSVIIKHLEAAFPRKGGYLQNMDGGGIDIVEPDYEDSGSRRQDDGVFKILNRILSKIPTFMFGFLTTLAGICGISVLQHHVENRLIPDMIMCVEVSHRVASSLSRALTDGRRTGPSVPFSWLCHVTSRMIVGSVAHCTIMVFGLGYLLEQFLYDEYAALCVLMLLWISELFIRISVRTKASVRVGPRLMGLYIYALILYLSIHPKGYIGLAQVTCAIFLAHGMLHLMNHFEIPALMDGRISYRRIRQFPRTYVISRLGIWLGSLFSFSLIPFRVVAMGSQGTSNQQTQSRTRTAQHNVSQVSPSIEQLTSTSGQQRRQSQSSNSHRGSVTNESRFDRKTSYHLEPDTIPPSSNSQLRNVDVKTHGQRHDVKTHEFSSAYSSMETRPPPPSPSTIPRTPSH